MKRIAITLGDVNGIGPEIALRSAHVPNLPRDQQLVLIGDGKILTAQAKHLGLSDIPRGGKEHNESDASAVLWDPAPDMDLEWKPGTVTADASRSAVKWIEAAVEGCLDGDFDAMVTAPICKEGLQQAGFAIPGHTEYLAELTKTKRFAMMLIGGPLRVVLVTRHIPIRDVANTLSREKIAEALSLTAEALPWLGFGEGTIGVCGLNPHAGDGGAIGSEEQDVIIPAIEKARAGGAPVEGPVPPDVIFHKAFRGRYAAVVAMYHDQGLAPLKMVAFDTGVNITLGLPIVRTSPDHGTAFDIAGQGKADPTSLLQAIKFAAELSSRKNPWESG